MVSGFLHITIKQSDPEGINFTNEEMEVLNPTLLTDKPVMLHIDSVVGKSTEIYKNSKQTIDGVTVTALLYGTGGFIHSDGYWTVLRG